MSLLKKLALLGVAVTVVLAAGAAEAAPGKSSKAKPTGESAPATPDLVPWTCVPSCTGGTETDGSPSVIDGRMIGTTGDFANFSLIGELADPKSVLIMRIWTEGNGDPGNLQVGIFDPDHRGKRLGKIDGSGQALWDVDRDVDRQPSTVPLRYRLCVEDPGNEFSCLGLPIAEVTSTDLAAYDNRWYQFSPIALGSSNEFHLLEISVDTPSTDPDVIRDILASGWNMFKVRARAVSGSGIKSPITVFVPGYLGSEDRPQVLGFGVPMVSIAEAEVLYPSFDFKEFTGVLTDTTYDGTWTFPAVNNPIYVTTTDPSVKLTIYDGDWDYGTADHPNGSVNTCPVTDPTDFDDSDDNSLSFPEPLIAALGCLGGCPPGTEVAVEAAKVGIGSQGSGLVQELPGPVCTSLSAPPDDWPEPMVGGGYFFRRVPSATGLTKNLGYVVVDRLNQEYVNDNPSGNQEFEKFEISAAADCDDQMPGINADACTGAILEGLYRIQVHGLDTLNLNHWIAPICYNGNTPDCVSLLCEDGAKPNVLNLAFTPLDCPVDPATDPYNSQTEETCFGALPTVDPVWIRARSPGGDLWYEGEVSVGENFVVSQQPKNFKGGNMVFEILDPNVANAVCNNDGSGAGCLQRIEFHISCSQPLHIADQFGSIEIVGGLQQK